MLFFDRNMICLLSTFKLIMKIKIRRTLSKSKFPLNCLFYKFVLLDHGDGLFDNTIDRT